MATAIEYGLIAAGISVAIIAVTNINVRPTIDWEIDKKDAAKACAARPVGSKENVVIKSWYGGMREEYSCPSWPSVFNPTHVKSRY